MQTVLGLSVTATNVQTVLVEGCDADGITLEHDAFDVFSGAESPIHASEQVAEAVLSIAEADGHQLHKIGVTWSEDADLEASLVLDSLAVRGFHNVVPVRLPQAAEALARSIGRVIGYQRTAVCVVEPDAMVLALVDTLDGEVESLVNPSVGDDRQLLDWIASVFVGEAWHPEGLFIVGSVGLFGRAGLVNQALEALFGLPPSRWFYGLPGVWLAQLFAFTPVAFMIMRGVVQGVAPSLEEAAQTLRASRAATFRSITLPLLKPGLANAFLVGFIESMADFGNPVVVGGQFTVLSTDIFFAIVGAQFDQGRAASLALVLTGFALLVFLAQQRLLRGARFTTVSGKGDSGIPMPLPPRVRRLVNSIALPWMAFTLIVYLFAFEQATRGGEYLAIQFGQPNPGVVRIGFLQAVENIAGMGRIDGIGDLLQSRDDLHVDLTLGQAAIEGIAHLPGQLLQAFFGFFSGITLGKAVEYRQ